MRRFVERLIYRKWFYGFLAVVLWVDCWTDFSDLMEAATPREVLSFVMSVTGAVLVTLVFVDLHWRRPPERR
jgi:hypothetical protein